MSAVPKHEESLAGIIGRIAALIGSDRFSTGERAALRRTAPGQLLTLAFLRFAHRHLPEHWDHSRDTMNDWVTIVAGIALMTPNAHRPDQGLGRALAETGYAESRLERLLASQGHARRVLLLRAARFLAAKNSAINWVEAAQLLLTRDPDRQEALHRRIAGDYFSAPSQGHQ